jgi:hypothetical protein
MPLSAQEKEFVKSIEKKIEDYNIPTTLEDALSCMSGSFAEVKYNDKKTEVVDAEIERHLCITSFNYFIRKYGIIPLPGKGYVPFDMYYIQEKALEEFEKHENVIFLKTRQVGMSTVTALYSLWKMLDEERLEVIDIISATAEKAKEFKGKMSETIRRMPLFLFPRIKDKTTGETRYIWSLRELPQDNKTQLEFPNGSKFKCETASENAGRGDGLSLLILDEAAFFKTSNLVEEIWKSAGPTLAKTKGKTIVISTPNGSAGKGEWYYKNWMEAKSGAGEFFPITIDWWEIPDPDKGNIHWLRELVEQDYHHNPEVRQQGTDRAKYEEEKYQENKWLKKQRGKLGEVAYKQEILHDFITMGESVFSSEALERVKNGIKEPKIKDMLRNESVKGLWIWEPPIRDRSYIMAVDSSRGSGRDASGIQVFDPQTYTQVAEFRGFVSTKRLGMITRNLARYYNDAYTIIECNNLGEATFNEVYYSENDPYDNVYKKHTTRNGRTFTIGWDTTPKERIKITEEFINFVSNEELFSMLKIRSERLYTEMTTWIFDGSKPIHAEGMHDDLIISYCLALYNRSKFERNDSFIISSEGEVDYSHITTEDIQEMKESKKFEHPDGLSIEEFKEKRKKDKFMKNYGVDYYDYSWLLGFDPSNDN